MNSTLLNINFNSIIVCLYNMQNSKMVAKLIFCMTLGSHTAHTKLKQHLLHQTPLYVAQFYYQTK